MSISSQFAAVDCPLCCAPQLWKGAEKCPGCSDVPVRGGGKISRFKLPLLFLTYPELARIDTEREMPAVRLPKPEDK